MNLRRYYPNLHIKCSYISYLVIRKLFSKQVNMISLFHHIISWNRPPLLLKLACTPNSQLNLKMDKLTKDQKDEYATSFAALALYDVSYTYERKMITSCATKYYLFANR